MTLLNSQSSAPASARHRASCGKCGYAVEGLETFTCPECGSDLRQVGIVAGGRWSPKPWLWAGLWTLVLPWPAIVGSILLITWVAPFPRETRIHRQMYLLDRSAAYSSPTASISAVQTGHKAMAFGGNRAARLVSPATMNLELRRAGGATIPMTVDLRSGAYTWTIANGSGVSAASGFGAPAILKWLGAAGYDVNDPAIQQAASELKTCIDEMPAASGRTTRFPVSAGGSGLMVGESAIVVSQIGVNRWIVPALVGGWFIVWIWGLGIIYARFRRPNL